MTIFLRKKHSFLEDLCSISLKKGVRNSWFDSYAFFLKFTLFGPFWVKIEHKMPNFQCQFLLTDSDFKSRFFSGMREGYIKNDWTFWIRNRRRGGAKSTCTLLSFYLTELMVFRICRKCRFKNVLCELPSLSDLECSSIPYVFTRTRVLAKKTGPGKQQF